MRSLKHFMSTIYPTPRSSTCKHLSESTRTSSMLVIKVVVFLSSFFFWFFLFYSFFQKKQFLFREFFFFIMETFYFIYGSGLSLRLFMVILSSIPTSFFTFYDGGLYVFCVISLPSCLFIIPIPFTSSIDNAPYGIKLLIVKNSFPIIW